jgi:predicted nucleotidyltransferase
MSDENAPMPPIAVAPREWEQLTAILRSHLPGCRVWAFGSRATGQRVKRFSDLDLAIDGEMLASTEAAFLAEALDKPALPFKVDLVELSALAPDFRARIEPDLVLVQEDASSPEKAAQPDVR